MIELRAYNQKTQMDSARELFEELKNLKKADTSKQTPEQRLLRYCREVLGSVERLHVDFKEKHDRSHERLEDDDKKNLAKAISGFANSGGGVLVWGIKDKSISPQPITSIQLFISSLLELAPQVTDPVVEGIDGDWIPSDAPVTKSGFGLVLIPESLLPPHRVLLKFQGIHNHYYLRSGSSFVVASHTQLEDMFGRRPQPKLALHTRIIKGITQDNGIWNLRVVLGIENKGRGTAKAPFLSVEIEPPYGIYKFGLDGNRHFGLEEVTNSRDTKERKYGSSADVVIHSGVIHEVTVIAVQSGELHKTQSGIQDLRIHYKIAAEGTRLIEGYEVLKKQQLLNEAKS